MEGACVGDEMSVPPPLSQMGRQGEEEEILRATPWSGVEMAFCFILCLLGSGLYQLLIRTSRKATEKEKRKEKAEMKKKEKNNTKENKEKGEDA